MMLQNENKKEQTCLISSETKPVTQIRRVISKNEAK